MRSVTGIPTTARSSGSAAGCSSATTVAFSRATPPELAERGLIVTGVAGAAAHHAGVLRSDAAQPGQPLELRRDPRNEHDPNAIAVHVTGGDQLGWVPRAVAAGLASELDARTPWAALALRDSRPSPRDPRAAMTMLLGRGEAIELRERSRTGPRSA